MFFKEFLINETETVVYGMKLPTRFQLIGQVVSGGNMSVERFLRSVTFSLRFIRLTAMLKLLLLQSDCTVLQIFHIETTVKYLLNQGCSHFLSMRAA